MRHLPRFLAPLAALAAISILVAEEAQNPPADAQPAAAVTSPPAPVLPRYQTKIVVVPIPALNHSQRDSGTSQEILQNFTDWEIVNVIATTAPVRPGTGAGAQLSIREVLIYTLRKSR